MNIIIASNNKHKIEEIKQILSPYSFAIRSLNDFPAIPEPPEEHDTFEGNAKQKAQFVYGYTGGIVISDDSGLAVDALNGSPGVHSKRYTPQATALANNQKLLRVLGSEDNRNSRFVCAVCVFWQNGHYFLNGFCEGQIAKKPIGDGGFGYDPIFIPDAFPTKTMAQLSSQEKNAISHRGVAFSKIPAALKKLGLIS